MSSSAKPSGLRDLEARIKSLPDQERLKRQRDLFEATKLQAVERVATVRTVLRQVRTLRDIDGNARLLAAEERTFLSTVQALATELAGLVVRPSPHSNTLGRQLDAIKRATTGLGSSVNTTWSAICRQYFDRAEALMSLAEKVSPNALGPLHALVRLLRSHTSPPTSPSGVQSLLTAIAQFNAAIHSMNIDGPVGRFLQDASTTGADPQALFDPEIKKHLDDNPHLWTALRVWLK